MLNDGTNKIKQGGPVNPEQKQWWKTDKVHFILSEDTIRKDSGMDKNKNESGNKYLKRIVINGDIVKTDAVHYGYIDVYAVIEAFGVTCPAIAHAIKKLLLPGGRGDKDTLQDIKESKDAIVRAFDMEIARTNLITVKGGTKS